MLQIHLRHALGGRNLSQNSSRSFMRSCGPSSGVTVNVGFTDTLAQQFIHNSVDLMTRQSQQ